MFIKFLTPYQRFIPRFPCVLTKLHFTSKFNNKYETPKPFLS
jgi:hypothetical protein